MQSYLFMEYIAMLLENYTIAYCIYMALLKF